MKTQFLAASETAASGRKTWAQLKPQVAHALAGDLRVLPILACLIGLWVVFASLSPFFLSPRNLSQLMSQVVPTGLLALAFIFILFLGEMDMSLALSSAVSTAVGAHLLVNLGWPVWIAVLCALAVGAGIALIQILVVLVFGAPSFLVTLGGMLILTGALILILPLKSAQISLYGTPLADLGTSFMSDSQSWCFLAVGLAAFAALRYVRARNRSQHGLPARMVRTVVLPSVVILAVGATANLTLRLDRGVPWAFGLLILILAVSSYVMTQTTFGLHIMAVGGNREAARRAGVKVWRVIVATFIMAGCVAALSGLASAIRQTSVSSLSGAGLIVLDAAAAGVIGGVSLYGGRGSVWAALLGAVVLATIQNGLDLLGAPTHYRVIAQGLILVIAIVIDASIVRGSLFVKRGAAA